MTSPTPTIERLARAVCEACPDLADSMGSHPEDVVLAILTALREPSEGMTRAGIGICDAPGSEFIAALNGEEVNAVWQAILDHLINEARK